MAELKRSTLAALISALAFWIPGSDGVRGVPCYKEGLSLTGGVTPISNPAASPTACYDLCVAEAVCEGAVFDGTNCHMLSEFRGSTEVADPTKGLVIIDCPDAYEIASCKWTGVVYNEVPFRNESNVLEFEECKTMCRKEALCNGLIYDAGLKSCHMVTNIDELRISKGGQLSIWDKDCNNKCTRMPDPPNGHFECEDYEELGPDKTCTLICDDNYLPSGVVETLCFNWTDGASNTKYNWTVQKEEFNCYPQVAVAVGGMQDGAVYTSNVEVVSPSQASCNGAKMPDFPYPVVGAVSGMVGEYGIVCGGAAEQYVNCRTTLEGGQLCDNNVEGVRTTGGTIWYFGPRSRDCYFYDHKVTKLWQKATQLRFGRAFASVAELPGRKLWILGGLGVDSILDSTEEISYDLESELWLTRTGPARLRRRVFGACAVTHTNMEKIMFAGGFDEATADYTDKIETYNLRTKAWVTEASGFNKARYDHTCKVTTMRGVPVIVAAGGYNKDGVAASTEILDQTTRTWNLYESFENRTLAEIVTLSLPYMRRSAQLFTEPVSGSLYMLGGVSCGAETAGASEPKKCARMRSGLRYDQPGGDPSTDSWVIDDDAKMKMERSAHTVLVVPKSHVCLMP